MQGKAADRLMLLRMIEEIKLSRDWFRCVFVVFDYVKKVFSECQQTLFIQLIYSVVFHVNMH